jgi:diguanylate cyclase (GGDEF)-like protein/PAS domain S-box-containing protein
MGINNLITSSNDAMALDVTLQNVLDFMLKYKTKHVVLVKDKKAIAILTERDILFLYTKHTDFTLKALEFANTRLIASKDNRKIDYILSLMVNHNIRRVLINNNNNEYLGSIIQEDLIHQFEKDVYKSHIKIEEILKKTNSALYVTKDLSLQDSIEIMSSKNIGSLLIYDRNTPIGIITESDIVYLAQKNVDTSDNIQKHMHSPIISFSSNDLLFNIVRTMRDKSIRRAVIFHEVLKEYFVITSKDILNNIKGNYSLFLESKLKDAKDTFNSLDEAVIELFDNDEEEQVIHWFNKKAFELFDLSIDDNITTIIKKDKWKEIYASILRKDILNNVIVKIKDDVFRLNIIQTNILDNSIIKLLFTNISQIVKANKEIEDKLHETFEQESIGILNIDLNYKIINANSKCISLFQYTKEEFIGKSVLDITYEEDRRRTISKTDYLLENQEEKCFSFEKRGIRKDGSLIWLNVTKSLSLDENGHPKYFTCFVMDITKQIDLKQIINDHEEKFKVLYEEVPYSYQSLDKNGIIKDVNKKWLELTGYKKEEVIGKKFASFLKDDEAILKSNFANFVKNSSINDVRYSLIKKDKSVILVSFDGKISNIDNKLRTHCILQDITNKVKIDKKLKLSDIVFENTTEGIIITNSKNEIVSINKAFTKITQYSRNDVLDKNPSIFSSGKHNKNFYSKLWQSLKDHGFWKGEIWNRKKNGEIYAEWLNISTVTNDRNEITNYVAIFSDITKIKESAAKIEYLAHHDPLTDLPNRLLLHARLENSLERSAQEQKKLAVLFIDIDNFKLVNDTYGHTVGDNIITLVANRLKVNIRRNDTIARIGGDEFIIVIEDIKEQSNIEKIAYKIIQEFKDPIKLQEYNFDTTVSIGISIFPNNGLNAEDLIKHADTAMYSAKNSGRNQFQFYKHQMTSDIFEKIIMKQEITDALKNEEFEVYYQAQIDIKTKAIVGAEALVRWNHKSLGLVSPDNFIPHAEETKLIIPLGAYVLKKACLFMKKLHDSKILAEGKIAVNISAEQIKYSDIVKTVINTLKYSKLDSRYLEIEVTETFIMDDIEKSTSILKELKDIGVKLSIDDFGTGYSSLSYIKQFPIDKLKIDKSFIDELPGNHKDVAIAKTVIALAQGLRIKTIAEGVETKEQKEFLENSNCDEIQGWFYSKALKENDFIKYIEEYK